jgi:hypothetical protein
MVKRGYAGLLLDEPSTRFYTFDAPTDVAAFVLYATQERRALDLLATMPEIDRGRIGFVGWSNGAILGSLLAGLEDRIKAYVFLRVCGMTTFSPKEKKSMNVPTGAAWARRYAAQMSVSDNVAYVGHDKGAKLLFINGKDDVGAMHDARAFLAAAPKASTWHVYAGGPLPQRRREQILAGLDAEEPLRGSPAGRVPAGPRLAAASSSQHGRARVSTRSRLPPALSCSGCCAAGLFSGRLAAQAQCPVTRRAPVNPSAAKQSAAVSGTAPTRTERPVTHDCGRSRTLPATVTIQRLR